MKKDNKKIKFKMENKIKKSLIISVLILIFSYFSFFFFDKSVNNKTRIDFNYKEEGNISYKVYLKDNEFYENNYLEEGMQYIAGLIKSIGINFNYKFSSDLEADYNYRYNINAKVVVTEKNNSSKVLYTKEENLYSSQLKEELDTNLYVINDKLDINYNKYNKIVENFKNEYNLLVDGNLIITMNVYSTLSDIKSIDDFNKTKTLSIIIPLSKNTIDITTSPINEDGNVYTMSNTEVNNIILFIIYIIVTIVDIVSIVYLYLNIRKILLNNSTPYMRKLKKIMREYDRIIVETVNKPVLSKYNIIDVKSFDELVDAKDNFNNAILYLDIKTGKECWFVLIHEKNLYRYILKDEGLNEKK